MISAEIEAELMVLKEQKAALIEQLTIVQSRIMHFERRLIELCPHMITTIITSESSRCACCGEIIDTTPKVNHAE